jgi:hypothetical protein
MTLGECPLIIFCSRGTPPREQNILDTHPHTVGYDPIIRSQLAPLNQLFEPYVVQIWSRNTLKLRGDETLELHRVAGVPRS